MADLTGSWRKGNFLYPYARALMLATGKGPASDGIGWGNNTKLISGDPAAGTAFRVMFLNSGVGTAYNFSGAAQAIAGALPAPLSGNAVTGYAWNPVAQDTAGDLITPTLITNNDQFRGSTNADNTASDLGSGRFAGSIVTSLAQIPLTHRTFNAYFPNPSGATEWGFFGGTANTAYVSGTYITYNGVADASDVTIYQVPSGAMVSAFVLYRLPSTTYSASFAKTAHIDAESTLIAYFDSATGLPVQGNGGDITIVWDNGYNKIFKI